MRKTLCIIAITLIQLTLTAQNINLFRTIYFPANPYGGEKELKEFVKQFIVYPDSALNNKIEGSVFITFLVDNKGKVKYKKADDNADTSLVREAVRIFDHILWEVDDSRNNNDIGYEKIRIDFENKKYLKLVRKRGYHHLPYPDSIEITKENRTYSINEVEKKPEITNASSVNDYVKKNFKYPDIALQRGVSGRVTLELVIEPFGIATNIRVVEALAGGCNEETERLLKGMKWSPGIKDGKAVRTLYRYELNFVNPKSTMR